ncbi:MAG: sugar phosphate nucleotidyltransferase, partial [Candidatus Micrarchaeaceae archaeon]
MRLWAMQGLITAAGLGVRAHTGSLFRKVMLPIYDFRDEGIVIRPIIDCAIYRMKRIGINDITVVLDPADSVTYEYIKRACDVSVENGRATKGFGDAVLAGSKGINGRFMLNAGDGVILDYEIMERLKGSSFKSVLSLIRVKDPQLYGIAKCGAKRGGAYVVEEVVEKPKMPVANTAIAAVYVLDEDVVNYIPRSGENIELTDA